MTMRLYILTSIFLLAISRNIKAELPDIVFPSSVTINYEEHNIKVTANSSEKNTSISISIDGKEIKLKGDAIYNINRLDLSSIRVEAHKNSINAPKREVYINEGCWFFFNSSRGYHHGSEEKEVTVFERIYFYFVKGNLELVYLATPMGDHKNKWTIKSYGFNDKGKKVENKTELVDSIKEPYTTTE